MEFTEAIKSFFTRYFDFKTRSSRSEYWWVVLCFWGVFLALLIPFIVFGEGGDNPLATASLVALVIFYIACFIPMLALCVRRFHDQDKSGWFYLISFIPYVGGLIILIFMCLEGTKGPNRFGPDPLNPHFDDVFT